MFDLNTYRVKPEEGKHSESNRWKYLLRPRFLGENIIEIEAYIRYIICCKEKETKVEWIFA